MRITKHEAAVIAHALNYYKYEAAKMGYTREEGKKIFSIIENLQKHLEDNEHDKRLDSRSERVSRQWSLTQIILKKLKKWQD